MPRLPSKTHVALFAIVAIGVAMGFFSQHFFQALAGNTIEAMKAVVEADAALIGFLAIITIFTMTSTQDERRRIPEKISCEDEVHRRNIERYESSEREYEDYKEKIDRLSYYAARFSAFLDATLFAALVSATFFLFSWPC